MKKMLLCALIILAPTLAFSQSDQNGYKVTLPSELWSQEKIRGGHGWRRHGAGQGEEDSVFASVQVMMSPTEVTLAMIKTALESEYANPAVQISHVLIEETSFKGAACVHYKYVQRNPKVSGVETKDFTMRAEGYQCLHPHANPPGTVGVNIDFNERIKGPPPQGEEILNFRNDAQQFFDNFTFVELQ